MMGGGLSIVKGSSLEDAPKERPKIDGNHGLLTKRVLWLCQLNWPEVTAVGNINQEWRKMGSLDEDRQQVLCLQLENQFPGQMYYLHIWNNYAWQKKCPASAQLSRSGEWGVITN